MLTWRLLSCGLTLGLLLAATGSAQAAPACDLADIKTGYDLHEALGKRAVEVVQLAAKYSAKDTKRLEALVAPDADFDLGRGDSDHPLGRGVDGARALAGGLHADLFIFEGWDRMYEPAETPCAAQKVTVEFLDSRVKQRCSVTFTFVDGRVTFAEGWQRSYTTGPMTPPPGK